MASGLRRVGSGSLAKDALPRRVARNLELSVAWREVAGPELSRRTEPLGVTRGVLDMRVAEDHWLRALEELLPVAIARLGAARPELGIRRYRVCVATETPRGPSLPVPPAPDLPPELPTARPSRAPRSGGTAPEPLQTRLRSLARRYLERTESRRGRDC